jgi:hypothetical protein
MRTSKSILCLILAISMCVIASCAPSLRKIGRQQGCEIAEDHLQTYIVQDIRQERFKKNLPYRAVLLPLSVTLGFFLNYLGQLSVILPVLAPTGATLGGGEVKAPLIQQAITYSPFKGTRLDRVDDSVIANANFDLGMCYYQSENWSQASSFFESLLDSHYSQYIGEENLLFLLGDCYYMLSLFDRSAEDYRKFMDYCRQNDDRIPLVQQRIKVIEAMSKKGLWGMENEEEGGENQ